LRRIEKQNRVNFEAPRNPTGPSALTEVTEVGSEGAQCGDTDTNNNMTSALNAASFNFDMPTQMSGNCSGQTSGAASGAAGERMILIIRKTNYEHESIHLHESMHLLCGPRIHFFACAYFKRKIASIAAVPGFRK
jgi:hypothetical protein